MKNRSMEDLSNYHRDITYRLILGVDPRACSWPRFSRLVTLRNAVSLRLIGSSRVVPAC